jgi:hypothetical protein
MKRGVALRLMLRTNPIGICFVRGFAGAGNGAFRGGSDLIITWHATARPVDHEYNKPASLRPRVCYPTGLGSVRDSSERTS